MAASPRTNPNDWPNGEERDRIRTEARRRLCDPTTRLTDDEIRDNWKIIHECPMGPAEMSRVQVHLDEEREVLRKRLDSIPLRSAKPPRPKPTVAQLEKKIRRQRREMRAMARAIIVLETQRGQR